MNRLRMVCVVVGFVLVSACACKSGSRDHTGPGGKPGGASCDAIKDHGADLYRAESSADKDAPALAEEQVADNVQMVIDDCAQQPDKVAPCAAKATSVADLEQRCLIPLDEEGTEGDRFGEGT
jgi:hypothetical protein